MSFGGDRFGDLVESGVGYGGISGCSVAKPAAALSRARLTEPEGLCFLFFDIPSPVPVPVDPRLSDSISRCAWGGTEVVNSYLMGAAGSDCYLHLTALLLASIAFQGLRGVVWTIDA